MAKKLALLLLIAGLVAGTQAAMTFRGQEAQTIAAAKALAQRHGVDASKFIKTGAIKEALLTSRERAEEKVINVKKQAISMINVSAIFIRNSIFILLMIRCLTLAWLAASF